MRVAVLRTPEEKAAGVLAFPSPLPTDLVLLFVDVLPGHRFHMRGVKERIAIFFLDDKLNVIDSYSLGLGQFAITPARTKHVVEMSGNAADYPTDFSFLKDNLNPPSGLAALGRLIS